MNCVVLTFCIGLIPSLAATTTPNNPIVPGEYSGESILGSLEVSLSVDIHRNLRDVDVSLRIIQNQDKTILKCVNQTMDNNVVTISSSDMNCLFLQVFYQTNSTGIILHLDQTESPRCINATLFPRNISLTLYQPEGVLPRNKSVDALNATSTMSSGKSSTSIDHHFSHLLPLLIFAFAIW